MLVIRNKPNFMHRYFEPLLTCSPNIFVCVSLRTKKLSVMTQKPSGALLVL